MIPTREQIEGDWIDPVYSPNTVVLGWLRAMRDDIDRLTAELRCSGDALDVGRCNSVDSIVSELRGGA